MDHTKLYRDITVPYETLIKKVIMYANPTAESKTLSIRTTSPYLRVKQPKLQIQPYSNG